MYVPGSDQTVLALAAQVLSAVARQLVRFLWWLVAAFAAAGCVYCGYVSYPAWSRGMRPGGTAGCGGETPGRRSGRLDRSASGDQPVSGSQPTAAGRPGFGGELGAADPVASADRTEGPDRTERADLAGGDGASADDALARYAALGIRQIEAYLSAPGRDRTDRP